jgi:hypothetical protein
VVEKRGVRGGAEIVIAHESDVPPSERAKYRQLPDEPGQAFITVDVSNPPLEPGNEGTEREWVARYG